MRQRGEDGHRGVHAGHQVGEGDAELLRPAAGQIVALAGDAHQPAHGLDDEVVAGQRRQRPVLAETGDRAVDEARVDCPQRFVAQAVALERADLVVLDQDVAAGGQLAHQRLAVFGGDVDGHRLLAAVGGQVVGRLAGVVAAAVLEVGRAPAARVVAAAGAFDLDHLRAQVGQGLPGPGAGEHARQVEHAQVGEGAVGHRGRLLTRAR